MLYESTKPATGRNLLNLDFLYGSTMFTGLLKETLTSEEIDEILGIKKDGKEENRESNKNAS